MVNRVGEVYYNKKGLQYTIIYQKNSNIVSIQYEDLYIQENVIYRNAKNGEVKNPNFRNICNVGYIGIGEYKVRDNGKLFPYYKSWDSMIRRCYYEKYKIKFPAYNDVTVCEEWHNFQNFAKWFEENYNPETMQGWHLDKDILVKGNKIYSPESCCFIPREINNLFTKRECKRGEYPIGVQNIRNRFKASFTINKQRIFLGYFDTPEEAFQAYKKTKESYIKEAADKWKDKIDSRVYEAMYNYQVEITD